MRDFIKISRYAGMREDLVQAGGGNSSYKESENRMYIKASGYQLAEVCGESGYAIVDPLAIQKEFLGYGHDEDITEEASQGILKKAFIQGGKPSIETFLHAVSGKYTLHTHPVVVNALTCRDGGMEVLKGLFGEALLVPYAAPGIGLAREYFHALKSRTSGKSDFDIVFLQNHGLVVSGDSAEDVIGKTEMVTSKIEKMLGADMSTYHNVMEVWRYFEEKIVWRITDEHVLNFYRENGGIWRHDFCPDCVVFLGESALVLPEEADISASIEAFHKQHGGPSIVIYKDYPYIVAENVKKAMEMQSVLSFSAQVMQLNHGYRCNFLSRKEKEFLLDWDAEKYRKCLKT